MNSPIEFKTESLQKLPNTKYFFAEPAHDTIANLTLADYNNNLLLDFYNQTLITVYYNLEDDDDYPSYFFNSTKLYFRLPGEHLVDGKRFDMEVQIYAFGYKPGEKGGDDRRTLVSLPVKIDDSNPQTQLFDLFENPKLGQNYTISSLDYIFTPFVMFENIYYYSGKIYINIR
jgi:hypothetical protein